GDRGRRACRPAGRTGRERGLRGPQLVRQPLRRPGLRGARGRPDPPGRPRVLRNARAAPDLRAVKPGMARTWPLPRGGWALRATLLAAWMACAAPACAGTVVVLRSRALAPYDSAIAGFEAAFRNPVTRF